MIPASEKGRRPLTAGEEGEIFELPDDIIEKEFRPVTLDKSTERATVGELKSIYYTYRLARKVLPDNFIEVVASQKKGGKLKLYSRKINIPEEDQKQKEEINILMQKAHAGEITRSEMEAAMQEYDRYMEDKYPQAGALLEKLDENGIQVDHWQMNALFDIDSNNLKFCEAQLQTAQIDNVMEKIAKNSTSIKEAIPKIHDLGRIFISDGFSYVENKYPDLTEKEYTDLNQAVNVVFREMINILKNSDELWLAVLQEKAFINAFIRLLNIELVLRKFGVEKTIVVYNKISDFLKNAKHHDPGTIAAGKSKLIDLMNQ